MKRSLQVSILITSAFVFLFGTIGSTSALVEQLTLEQLTIRADSIMVGTVTNVAYERDASLGAIWTLATVSVDNAIKGSPRSGEVVVKVLGGEIDGLRLWVEDSPDFRVSERVLLFLERDEGSSFRVCGWDQGKFLVQGNEVVERGTSLGQFTSQVTDIMMAHGMPVLRSANQVVSGGRQKLASPTQDTSVLPLVPREAQAASSSWQTIMSEDFEGAFPGSWSRGGNPTWGTDTYNPHTGTYSAWCAKSGFSGVNPPCEYPNNTDSWIAYGPFDLSDATAAVLNFYYWNNSEFDYDYFKWGASIDGIWYNYHASQRQSGYSGGWQYASLDLTDVANLGNLCGESEVWIAFWFESDACINKEGAFVDDIELIKWTGESPPVIGGMTPSEGSAGTETEVTISGSNFGSLQGASSVTFQYQPSSRIEAPIVSWSDTSIVAQVPARASSGSARVTTGAGDSNDHEFYVTFGFGGRWVGPNPMARDYFVHANTADCDGELAAIQTAFQTWNDVTSADFNFTYGGPTTATEPSMFWPNGANEIMWNDDLLAWGILFPGAIAVNVSFLDAGTSQIMESDILLNDLYYDWDTGGSPLAMDVQNVVTHELGHSLRLLDLYGSADSEKTMYGIAGDDATKARTLEPDDIAGIRWIYPDPSPEVESGEATAIATTSATLAGNLTSLGSAASVDVSFEWGRTAAYGNETPLQTMTGLGACSGDLTDLQPDRTYYYRAKAVGDGTAYGEERIFTTESMPEPAPLGYRDIPLSPSWNLVALPLIPDDPDIDAVLASIVSNVLSVWAYDGATESWQVYTPGPAPDSLTEMVDGRGYWINMAQADTLTIWGTPGLLYP